jgi:hypothetical protein
MKRQEPLVKCWDDAKAIGVQIAIWEAAGGNYHGQLPQATQDGNRWADDAETKLQSARLKNA